MSVITDIVSGIAGSVGKAAIDIRTAITGLDPATAGKLQEIAANLEAQKAKAETDLLQGQLDVNKIEAASGSSFRGNWRPAIGWVGAISLMLMYWPKAIITMVVWTEVCIKAGGLTPFPDLGLTDLVGIIGPMLGIAGMRTAEKFKGVAS